MKMSRINLTCTVLKSMLIYLAVNMMSVASVSEGIAPLITLNDGNKIPHIALGTYLGFTDSGVAKGKENEVKQAVEWAIECGYRHIDTAALYEDEDQVGAGVQTKINDGTVKREDIFITTKLANEQHRMDQVIPALKESLSKLNMSYVDLYLIHWPIDVFFTDEDLSKRPYVDYLETWKAMEEAKRKGLAKSIGVSNFNIEQMKRLLENAKIKPAALEVEVNPNLINKELIDYCKQENIAVLAYSPFGSLIPSRSNKDTPEPKIDNPVLVKMANKYKKTTPQIVLRYLIDRGTIPLPKSTNKQRIQQNIDVFDFKLTPEEISTIDKFNNGYRIVNPTFWSKHPLYPFEKV